MGSCIDGADSGGTGQVLGIGQPGPQIREGRGCWGGPTATGFSAALLALLACLTQSSQQGWGFEQGLGTRGGLPGRLRCKEDHRGSSRKVFSGRLVLQPEGLGIAA